MILYHFTAIEYLEAIKEEGITKGEVPITRQQTENAVWLTSDPDPEGHGLSDGEFADARSLRFLFPGAVIADDAVAVFPDKRCVRITVRIPSSDRALKHWPTYGRKKLERAWYDDLSKAGGGSRKARSWYLSLRPINPSEFVAIDILRESRTPKPPATDE